MIIIVSDLHLGSAGTEWQQFEKFLDEIENCKTNQQGDFANVHTLILLGDNIDLTRDSLRDIGRDYKERIFRRLQRLNDLPDFRVFFFLGNHDLYLEKYDQEGKRTEIEFIDPVGFPFYEEMGYVALLRNHDGKWRLDMYDERGASIWKRIKRFFRRLFRMKYNPEQDKMIKYDETFYLGPSSAETDFLCLLCHGHQLEFMDDFTAEAGHLLSILPDVEKTVLRGLMDSTEVPLRLIRRFMSDHAHKWLQITRSGIHRAFDLTPFGYEIDVVTHFIYGHTHLVDPKPKSPPEAVTVPVAGLTVVNSGCWLMTKPTYVVIHDDGKMTTHHYESAVTG
ncbi:MAG: metallophosphoesterase [Candidatus Odinarchaeota archaeon]